MGNYIESLKFRYSKETGKIYAVRVNFTAEDEDSILITPSFFKELYEYIDVSEADKDLFYVLAKAIQLSKENNRGSAKQQRVKKYTFRTPGESFSKRFVKKLMLVTQCVPIGCIADFFNEDSKVEDLDIFLNKKDVYQLILFIRDGIDEEPEISGYSEEDF